MAADECSTALPCQAQVCVTGGGWEAVLSCYSSQHGAVRWILATGVCRQRSRAPRGNAKLDRLARRLRSLFLAYLLWSCGPGRAVVVGAVGSHKAYGAEPSSDLRPWTTPPPLPTTAQLACPDSWGLVCHRLQCHPRAALALPSSSTSTSPLPAARAGRSYGGVQSLHASAAASGVQ